MRGRAILVAVAAGLSLVACGSDGTTSSTEVAETTVVRDTEFRMTSSFDPGSSTGCYEVASAAEIVMQRSCLQFSLGVEFAQFLSLPSGKRIYVYWVVPDAQVTARSEDSLQRDPSGFAMFVSPHDDMSFEIETSDGRYTCTGTGQLDCRPLGD